jgi:hypothetical protein
MKFHTLAAVSLATLAIGLSACGKKDETTPAADAATADAAATAPADSMAAAPPADSMAATPPADGSMAATPPADAMATTPAPQTETAPNSGAVPPK